MNMQDFENAIVTEWSPSQRCFHVHSVWEMLEHNQRTFIRGNPNDFIPIGLFGNKKDLNKFMAGAREHRQKLEDSKKERKWR